MAPLDTRDAARPHGFAWWAGWVLVTALVAGGVYLTLRMGPRMVPVLDAVR